MQSITPAPTRERSWVKDQNAASAFFKSVEGIFSDELVCIGREILGPDHPDDALIQAALAGGCHCHQCSARYARCTFSQPRHIGDVFFNLSVTGKKAAAYVAQAASRAIVWPDFAAVLSLGCGAGACFKGLDIADRLPDQRFGVEIEHHARRLLPHIVPDVQVDDDIRNLDLPDGPLLVVASLIWNLKVPSKFWAEEIARDRDEFFVLSVTRPLDWSNRHPAETWRGLGFTPNWPYDWRALQHHRSAWHPEGDVAGYGIELDHWIRK